MTRPAYLEITDEEMYYPAPSRRERIQVIKNRISSAVKSMWSLLKKLTAWMALPILALLLFAMITNTPAADKPKYEHPTLEQQISYWQMKSIIYHLELKYELDHSRRDLSENR